MRTRATGPWLRPVESTASLFWRGHACCASNLIPQTCCHTHTYIFFPLIPLPATFSSRSPSLSLSVSLCDFCTFALSPTRVSALTEPGGAPERGGGGEAEWRGRNMRTTMIAPVYSNNNINTHVCPRACSQLQKSRQRARCSRILYDE